MEVTLAPRPLRQTFLDTLDRPAREALRLERRPLWVTAGIALAGAVLIALGSMLSFELDELRFGRGILPRVDLLRALFEALVVVVPSGAILAAYFRVRVTPRAVLAAVAVGLLVAGVVVAATLPLMAYLAVYAQARPLVSPAAALPIVALAAVATTTARIVRAIDTSSRAHTFARALQAGLAGAFIVRVAGF